ncbi:Hypoxia-inducible factor prolyl hydroxylase [Diplonema papillatum]|nr:Hypoxia-inducible factor prolyl hydroxylase [Diplonema papillatum]
MSAAALVEQLNENGYGYVDAFIDEAVAGAVLKEAEAMTLVQGEVSSEAGYWQTETKVDRRGDHVCWCTVEEIDERHPALKALVKELHSVVCGMREAGLTRLCEVEAEKRGKVQCERVMIAQYPEAGRRFAPHLDNPNNNGRVLTFTYYLNKNYRSSELDGGALCIRESITGPPVIDIEPHFNRLAAIYSESTVHEVLPVVTPRWAVVVWFSLQSEDEKTEAMKKIFRLLLQKTRSA